MYVLIHMCPQVYVVTIHTPVCICIHTLEVYHIYNMHGEKIHTLFELLKYINISDFKCFKGIHSKIP